MDPDPSNNNPLRLGGILRQYARPNYVDSVDDEKRLRIDEKVNRGWERGQFCWEAKGPVAETYARLAPQIARELNQAREESSTEVSVLLYMVGKSVARAKPIIIVSGTDRASRDNAKMAIQRSGILTGSNFKLGSMPHPPSGRINPVANFESRDGGHSESSGGGIFESRDGGIVDDPTQTTSYEVLFDPKKQIRLVGMPIYIRHNGNHIRQATANAVCSDSRYGYITAAHALEKIEANVQPMSDEECDIDIPFDDSSDDEYEDDAEKEILSQYSETSLETSESEQPIISSANPSSSLRHSSTQTVPNESLFSSDVHPSLRDRAHALKASVLEPQFIETLRMLGRVSSVSTAVDCVVVTVTDTEALKALGGLKSLIGDISNQIVVEQAKRVKVVAWSVHGPLSGTLIETPVLMHLRNSSSFELVYKFTYQDDGRVKMGDCGALVTDVGGHVLYGHVIANSEHACVAFVVAAQGLVHELEIAGKWHLLGFVDRRPEQQAEKPPLQIPGVIVNETAPSKASPAMKDHLPMEGFSNLTVDEKTIPYTASAQMSPPVAKPSSKLSNRAAPAAWLAERSPRTAKAEAQSSTGGSPSFSSGPKPSRNASDAEVSTSEVYSDLFQTFAKCINGYEVIADACRYIENYQDAFIRTKLEEHRLLDWAKTIALDSTDARSQLDHSTHGRVMHILEQKHELLYSFDRLDESYQELANPNLVETGEELMIDSGSGFLADEASTILFPRTHLVTKVQSFNHQSRTVLRRLGWIQFSEDRMKILVDRLMHFNDELNDALDRPQRESLWQNQFRTSYQVVALNRRVRNLVRIVHSLKSWPSPYASVISRADAGYRLATQPSALDLHADRFEALVKFVVLDLRSEIEDIELGSIQRIRLNRSSPGIIDNSLDMRNISVAKRWDELDDTQRTGGTYKSQNIWIEWRSLKMFWWRYGIMERERHYERERIITLVALLKKMSKIVQFRAPECLGYIENEANLRYGIVFTNPEHTASYQSPTSLHKLLDESMPPLGDRITLMRLLCETMEILHAVDWLHNGVRSSNVLFVRDPQTQSADFAEPYLSGFEYARPATRSDMRIRLSEDLVASCYRHPRVQGRSNAGGFVKSHDLYSLGIVLLEIAYWKPIDAILGIDIRKARRKDIFNVRRRLLEDPQYSKYVKHHLGVIVESAIWSCLKGPEGFGMEPDCDERDTETAATMLREFGERVVIKLSEIKGL